MRKIFTSISGRNLITIFILSFLSFITFKSSFSAYFFQDDWFSLSISRVTNIAQIFKFFIPRSDVIYYRPLGMQIPFAVSQFIFGLNPLPFHIVTFIIHLLNGLLVYFLIKELLSNKNIAIFGTFLYLISATHGIIFYWSATFAFVLAPFFYFSSVLLYFRKHILISIVLFVMGLLSNELLISLPVLLLIYELVLGKREFKKLAIYFILTFAYLVMRWQYLPNVQQGDYQLQLGFKQLLLNLRDYCLWALNWPNEIHNQFSSFLLLNLTFMKNFLFQITTWMINTLLVLFVIGLSLLNFIRNSTSRHIMIFGGMWFVIGLMPVLFFSQHAFSYYVPVALVGLIVVLGSSVANLSKTINPVQYIILLLFIGSGLYAASLLTMEFDYYTHWAPRRSQLSQKFITNIRNKFPTLLPGFTVVVKHSGSSSEYQWAMGDENALKVIYNDDSISTLYLNKLDTLPQTSLEKPVVYFDLP